MEKPRAGTSNPSYQLVPSSPTGVGSNDYWAVDEFGYPKGNEYANAELVYQKEADAIGARAENGYLSEDDDFCSKILVLKNSSLGLSFSYPKTKDL